MPDRAAARLRRGGDAADCDLAPECTHWQSIAAAAGQVPGQGTDTDSGGISAEVAGLPGHAIDHLHQRGTRTYPLALNRRNYYRILHVQPEAPAQVITASYRTMMSKLRLHPDLGGDTAGAALINEAYAVLSDPAKRARYDLQLRSASAGVRTRAAAARPAAAPANDVPADCPFCHAAAPAAILPATRCRRCDSPLASPPARPLGKSELFGRRAVPRMHRSDPVTLVAAWQAPERTAELRDLSVTGIAVICDQKIERQQVIRIMGPLFDILATVVGCRSVARGVEVHASLLKAIFMRQKGVVVSVKT